MVPDRCRLGSVVTMIRVYVQQQQQEELSRKRKAPVASSVVRVNRAADEDSDDVEEEDTGYGGRGPSSRVSLPSKPERKSVFTPRVIFSNIICCTLLN